MLEEVKEDKKPVKLYIKILISFFIYTLIYKYSEYFLLLILLIISIIYEIFNIFSILLFFFTILIFFFFYIFYLENKLLKFLFNKIQTKQIKRSQYLKHQKKNDEIKFDDFKDLNKFIHLELIETFNLLENYLEIEENYVLRFLTEKKECSYSKILFKYYLFYILSSFFYIIFIFIQDFLYFFAISLIFLIAYKRLSNQNQFISDCNTFHYRKSKKFLLVYQKILIILFNNSIIASLPDFPLLKKMISEFNERLEYFKKVIKSSTQILQNLHLISILTILISIISLIFQIFPIIIPFKMNPFNLISIILIPIFIYSYYISPILKKIKISERTKDRKLKEEKLIRSNKMIQITLKEIKKSNNFN